MASVGVVEALDVLEQSKSGFGLCGKTPSIDQFASQAGEEALAQGVAVAVADRPHGGSDARLSASFTEGHPGVPRALVAVMDTEMVAEPTTPAVKVASIPSPTGATERTLGRELDQDTGTPELLTCTPLKCGSTKVEYVVLVTVKSRPPASYDPGK